MEDAPGNFLVMSSNSTMIQLTVGRDSVPLGVKGKPHAIDISVPSDATVADVLERHLPEDFLPAIDGDKATWVLGVVVPGDEERKPTEALAVIAQQWDEPAFLVAPHTRLSGRVAALHFRYWGQAAPGEVLQRLLANTPMPIRSAGPHSHASAAARPGPWAWLRRLFGG